MFKDALYDEQALRRKISQIKNEQELDYLDFDNMMFQATTSDIECIGYVDSVGPEMTMFNELKDKDELQNQANKLSVLFRLWQQSVSEVE